MKLSQSITLASTLLAGGHAVHAALDCSQSASRNNIDTNDPSQALCLHFGGIDPQGYHEWYNTKGISARYPNFLFMSGSDPAAPEDGVAVHWKVDGDYVNIAVATRATGWVGFGIAEAGGMIGADMVLFSAASPDTLVDAYTDDERNPKVDECSNDWELVDSNVDVENGFIMFETRRLLDTEDPQDRAIVDDASTLVPPHRVIAAWGDSDTVSYHGLNRARGSIRFFGQGNDLATFRAAMDQQAEGTFEVTSINHEIAPIDTEYAYYCVGRDELIADQGVLDTEEKLNIIGFEPILFAETEAYVHHFVVYASANANCTNDDNFGEIAYVWAPGEGPLALPGNLGSPLFGANGYQSFRIEVHYNNPLLTPGILDSSGVRFHWTSQPRDEEVGILSVGDPYVQLYGESVGEGLTLHEFECPGTCSSKVGQPVTVLREYLHMHMEGARITNEQIRNGQVIRSGVIDYWEFDQNGNAAVLQDPFVVQPGDSFRTSCYFDANDDTVFGLSSQEEMCMAFLYYYPRSTVAVPLSDFVPDAEGTFDFPWTCGYNIGVRGCETTYEAAVLDDKSELERGFGISSDECGSAADSSSSSDDGEGSGASSPELVVVGFVMGLVGLVL